MRKLMSLLLVVLIVFPVQATAQEQETEEVQVVEKTDPHQIFRFKLAPVVRADGREILMPVLPDDRYYDRDFILAGQIEKLTAGIQDRTGMPFEHVVNNAPQSSKGYLASWLKPGQCVGITMEEIKGLLMFGADGNIYRVHLPANWPVVYDCRVGDPVAEMPRDILAVWSCGNKVVGGAGLVKPIPVDQAIAATEELNTERLRQALVEATRPDLVPPVVSQTLLATTEDEEDEGGSNTILYVILGALVAGGVVALLLKGGDDDTCPSGYIRDVHGGCKLSGQPNDRPSIGFSFSFTIGGGS